MSSERNKSTAVLLALIGFAWLVTCVHARAKTQRFLGKKRKSTQSFKAGTKSSKSGKKSKSEKTSKGKKRKGVKRSNKRLKTASSPSTSSTSATSTSSIDGQVPTAAPSVNVLQSIFELDLIGNINSPFLPDLAAALQNIYNDDLAMGDPLLRRIDNATLILAAPLPLIRRRDRNLEVEISLTGERQLQRADFRAFVLSTGACGVPCPTDTRFTSDNRRLREGILQRMLQDNTPFVTSSELLGALSGFVGEQVATIPDYDIIEIVALDEEDELPPIAPFPPPSLPPTPGPTILPIDPPTDAPVTRPTLSPSSSFPVSVVPSSRPTFGFNATDPPISTFAPTADQNNFP